MTWHLKDRELERKLNELSNGEFSKNLHEFDEDIFASYFGKTIRIKNYSYCTEGGDDEPIIERIPKFGFYFTKDELEEVSEYNSKAWNKYPDVIPPEGVRMRVEARTLDDYGERFIVKFYEATYVDGAWRSSVEIKYPETLEIFRFRPWED